MDYAPASHPKLPSKPFCNLQDGDDYNKDFVERDERRLGDLGRRTVEMFALAHIYGELEAAYCEAESIKRQDALIREEEEAGQLEGARTAARVAADRGKKARKKVSSSVSGSQGMAVRAADAGVSGH